MTNEDRNEQLHWDAFRYISGEMNGGELASFEALLAEDQRARQAVAQSVELTQAARAALAPDPVVVSSRRSAAVRWWYGIAIGAAACLAVMFVVSRFQQADNTTAATGPQGREHAEREASERETASSRALAARWSQVRQQQAEFDPWFDATGGDLAPDPALADWPIDADEGQEAPESTTAPDWMIAALSQMHGGSDTMMGEMDKERAVDGPLEQ